MLKLWIVHRSPQQLVALARLCGLAETDLVVGRPSDDDFVEARTPAGILLGLDGDFEVELEFAHRQRARWTRSRLALLCRPEDVGEARRLFAGSNPEIIALPPTARTLRAFVTAAVNHRSAASLADRQQNHRVAQRFSGWLGSLEVPGLLRALDPSLSGLPLLVRGRMGSGRSLLCHYVEHFRGAAGSVLRLHGRDLRETRDLAERIRKSQADGGTPIRTVWIDEIDHLDLSTQNTLAEWILHGASASGVSAADLRWVATAGPSATEDPLEPSLEHAFAPLLIEVPSLAEHPETLARFAEEVSKEWTRSVGGVARHFADSALIRLEAHPWSGDRAELEAVLRTTLAGSSREMIEDVDLRFPSDPIDSEMSAPDENTPIDAIEALMALPEVEAEPETASDLGALETAYLEGTPAMTTALDSAPEADESTKLSEASLAMAKKTTSATPDPSTQSHQTWRRLARSFSHEIRNPLVSIRTFAELLPQHFEDETFRARFSELVGKDVAHISDVLSRLSSVAEREVPEAEAIDVSALIERLLEERRDRITQGRLLVLRELERDAPLAWADAKGLQVALAGLLDRALESLPERGDLFVATRRLDRGADGKPRLRILLRHHNPTPGGDTDVTLTDLDPTANVLEYVLAETVVESSGGSLTVDATDARETLILVDLQTPT